MTEPATSQVVVELRKVSRRFGSTVALDAVDLTVNKGECLVLAGPSGAGKTTLLRVVAGLEKVNEGTVFLEGIPVGNQGPWTRQVGMTFENYALYPHLLVRENIAFPLKSRTERNKGLGPTEIAEQVQETADMLGIGHLLDRRTDQLSGGQRQRVSLARCLVRDATVLLLDEPLAHLDAKLRMLMRTEFKRMVSNLDATMIYVTHDYREALALGDRIAVIHEGAIVQVGTQKEVFERPSCLFVAKFMGNPPMNIVRGFVENGGVFPDNAENGDMDAALGNFAALPGRAVEDGPIWIGIRPMDCTYDGGAGNGLSGILRAVKVQQDATESVLVETGGNVIQALLSASARPNFGEQINIRVDTSKALVFDQQTEMMIGGIGTASNLQDN